MPDETDKSTPAADSASALPVRAVTLFSSGVAYIQREGTVPSGETTVPLTFRTTQISDILKSLVLLDDGGIVRPAVYPSSDPVGRTLQTFAVDVTQNRSRADLLRSLRGAELRVQTFAGESMEGRIVGTETRDEFVGEREVSVETLTLLTTEGIVAIDLPRVRVLRLLDSRLDQELRNALMTLATGSDDARRTITLGFSGAQERTVLVGYLTEAPLWKVSYRLVLTEGRQAIPPPGDATKMISPPAASPGPAFAPHLSRQASQPPPPAPVTQKSGGYLQGWAIVDNTSDEDWESVDLSLVSGRPSSFIQDLYQPLYVARPVVAPDLETMPYPQAHGGSLLAPPPQGSDENLMMSVPASAPMRSMGAASARRVRSAGLEFSEQQIAETAQATGGATGELFSYDIDAPVTLPRQQAAMIPIVSQSGLPIEKLSLYSPHGAGDPKRPWNALRLTNSTDLHLKGGPITLFDGGTYAGEARIEDIPPGDSRLITYALDLLVEGERQRLGMETTRQHERLTIQGSVLHITRTRQRSEIYTLKSKAKEPRMVLVEQPFAPQWTLSGPPAAERTDRYYRFAVPLAAAETKTLTVSEEQPFGEMIQLISDPVEQFAVFVSAGNISVRIKNALRPVIEARRRIEEIDELIAACEAEIAGMYREQQRLRENLSAIEKETPLYRRYIADLEKQENRLALLHEEIAAHKVDRDSETTRLREYVATLAVE